MKSYSILVALTALYLVSCTPQATNDKQLSAEEKRFNDSISKIQQRRVVDSLKKKNPLLIMPPDSTYTGDYIDKYENGITKFRGFFRFGKQHGQWMSFYPNGTMWSELHFDKGIKHGPNITFYEDGKTKRYEGMYKNNNRDSIWCYYDSVGVIAEKVLFKNGVIVKKLPLK